MPTMTKAKPKAAPKPGPGEVIFNDPKAPGKVGQRHTHGMAKPIKGGDGVQALRDVLHLSRDCSVVKLCADAAARIKQLEAGTPDRKLD